MTSDIAIPQIDAPYLLVVNIPLYRHEGRYWANPLWAKDLLLHLTYIRQMLLFCPIEERAPLPDWVEIDSPHVEVVASPPGRFMALHLATIVRRMTAAVRRAAIVHASPIGWPFPLGWIAAWCARKQDRPLLINIESSFWRAPEKAGPLRRLRARLSETLAGATVNASDLALFTTDEYRRSLATHPRGETHLTPASWVDSAQVLTSAEAAARWREKPGRLLYAGRFTVEKGIVCLMRAIEQSRATVDIIGEGPLTEDCRAFAARHADRVRLLPPVAYGEPFFRLLDDYDAVIVPTLSDEQPRILFDAFARAIPAIVSDTPANVEIVAAHNLGIVTPRNDPTALAAALDAASDDRASLERLGMAALAYGASATHENLHRTRARHVINLLDRRRAGR